MIHENGRESYKTGCFLITGFGSLKVLDVKMWGCSDWLFPASYDNINIRVYIYAGNVW
jgi:hypothetical protein